MISISHLSDVSGTLSLNPMLAWMCKHKKHSTLVQAVTKFCAVKKNVLLSVSDQKKMLFV